jgi:hypothetical protein
MKKIILLFLLLLFNRTSVNAQWQQTSLNNDQVNCFAVKGTDLFAGTGAIFGGGDIYISTTNDSIWTLVNNGLPNQNVYDIAVSSNNIFAGTATGVYLSANNGTNWTAANTGLPSSKKVRALLVSGTTIFAGLDNSGVYLSTNNGTSWTAVNTGLTNLKVFALANIGTTIFASTNNGGGVFMTTNNGTSWTSVGMVAYNVLSLAVSGDTLFAGAYGSGIFISTNNGANWNAISPGMNVQALAVSNRTIVAGTFGGGISLSIDAGATWHSINDGLPDDNISGIAIINENIFAGTYNYGILKRSLHDFTGPFVWPGDANHDSIVDNNDLLSVGLNYNNAGISRDSTTNMWIAQFCPEWLSFQMDSINMKHADCNGDGDVNSLDTVAIMANYGATHAKKKERIQNGKSTAALSVIPHSPYYTASDTAKFDIVAGSISNPVNALYGIAYDIYIDPLFIKSGTLKFSHVSNWLGDPAANALSLSKEFESSGFIENAIIRMDKANQTGYGKIGELKFVVDPNLVDVDTMNITIIYYNAVDATGHAITFTVQDTSSIVSPITTSLIENTSYGFEVFPNPTNDLLNVLLHEKAIIEIYTINGQIIKTITHDSGETSINIRDFVSGVYIVRAKTDKEIVTKKFIKE